MSAASRAPIVFHGSPGPTIGVEVELQLIDPETGGLMNAAPRLLSHFPGSEKVKPELLEAVVEICTGICKDVSEVREDLSETLASLQAVCASEGVLLSGTGTHPFTDWRDLRVTPDDRYLELVQRMQWLARRFVIFGLHVHVGVPNGEKAIAISNSLSAYLPLLLGISASSPFWHAKDTGLASARVKLFEALPTAGLPHELTNWREFCSYMTTLMNANAIQSIREVWWDVRPHLGFGTLEIRICDGVNTMTEIVSMVGLIQTLVVWLGELYDAGEVMPTLRGWTLKENKWRACRWGTDAKVIINERGSQKPLAQKLHELLEDLAPTAARLGATEALAGIPAMIQKPSYKRQRAVYGETHSFQEVVSANVRELLDDAPVDTGGVH